MEKQLCIQCVYCFHPTRKEDIMNGLHDPCCPWDTTALIQAHKADAAEQRTKILSRELFYLWNFIIQQELWDEAREFLDEYMDDPAPFEFNW